MEKWACSLLRGVIEFKKENRNMKSNKRMWQPRQEWVNMLCDLEKHKVKVLEEFKRNGCLYSMQKWLKTSCTKSLVINDLTLDNEETKRNNLEYKLIGLLKLTNVDLNVINEQRALKLMSKLEMRDIQQDIKRTNEELMKCHSKHTWRAFKEEIEKMFNGTYEYLINACKL